MGLFQKIANLLWVYVICGVLLAGFGYQLATGEDPCALCFLERLEMIGIAVSILLNLRFGIRVEHYALAILVSVAGRLISLRQIALHICPQFPTFGPPVWGFDLYTWAFIVFNCSVFAAAILLLIMGLTKNEVVLPFWNLGAKIAFWLLVAITGANGLLMLKICGLSACS
jgi:disulfide bond formation protein DsbB